MSLREPSSRLERCLILSAISVIASSLLLLTLTMSCGRANWHQDPSELHTSTLKIQVFGSSTSNEQHYSSILTGAKAASDTEVFKNVQQLIRLEPLEDADNEEDAVQTAKRIRDDPTVLAVIGHSYSSTTRVALPFYEQAGIPVMIPAASSPYVMYRFDEHEHWPSLAELTSGDNSHTRFENAFRMIPGDVPSQVNALEGTARRLLRSGQTNDPSTREEKSKLMLICDTTKRSGANVYTMPICDSLREEREAKRSIANNIASYREIDLDSADIWGLVTEIQAVKPRFIVLVAYPELARVLLEELRERATSLHEDMKRYTFIMSEACLTNDLIGFGAKLYVTSPFNPTDVEKCLPSTTVKEMTFKHVVPTNEGYAFDAVVLLATAVADCKKHGTLDRRCIREFMEEHGNSLPGVCEQYQIVNGERRNAPYYVYSSCKRELKPHWAIMQDQQEPYEKDNWFCREASR